MYRWSQRLASSRLDEKPSLIKDVINYELEIADSPSKNPTIRTAGAKQPPQSLC